MKMLLYDGQITLLRSYVLSTISWRFENKHDEKNLIRKKQKQKNSSCNWPQSTKAIVGTNIGIHSEEKRVTGKYRQGSTD